MKKIYFIVFFTSLSFVGMSQTFCDTMFGDKFRFEIISDTINELFDTTKDSIDFFQYKKINNYDFIILNCSDSSFKIKTTYTVVIYEDENESSSEIYTHSSSNENDGKWTYNPSSNIINFKIINSEIWQHFRIETKGKEGDNPYITWDGSGDYRYLIRLIRAK